MRVPVAERATPQTPAAPVGVKVPAHQRFVLPNGLTIILLPKKDVPMIAFSGFVRGGALADPAGKPGVASLVAGLLDRGAGKRNAFEFADAVEGVGGSFSAAAGAEAISIGGQFLARDRALMIELLADALMRPRMDPMEFDELPRSRDRVHQVGEGFRSRRRSSASTDARRCSASIPSAVRRAAANVRSRRSSRRRESWLSRGSSSAPTAPRWYSPAISIRSG